VHRQDSDRCGWRSRTKSARLVGRQVKGGCLVPRQQMRVARERKGWRVVAEGAAQLEEVGALGQVERGEGVAKRVEARPGSACPHCEQLQDAAAEVAGVERASGFAGEGEGGRVLVGLGGEVIAQAGDHGCRQADLAAAVPALGRLDPLADDGAADAPRARRCRAEGADTGGLASR
jgi:hypothetical protein